MADNSTAMGYFSWDKLLTLDCVYNAAIGGRGIGKTFDAIRRNIKYALKHSSEFIYLRRYREELATAKANFFNEMHELFPAVEFRVNGNIGEYKKNGQKEWLTLCYFVALSTTQANKSVSYPKVKWILFDEFIIEKGAVRYLSNEVRVFDNFYSTVDRWKDKTRVMFAANSVMIDNPYFIEWNINPDDTEFIVKRGGFIGVQIVNSDLFMNRVSTTRFGRYIKDTEYAEFAMNNKFSDNTKELLGKRSASAIYRFTLRLSRIDVALWYDADLNKWYCEEKQPKEPSYFTMEPSKMSDDVPLLLKHDKLIQLIRTRFRYGDVLFDSARSRNSFREIFKG